MKDFTALAIAGMVFLALGWWWAACIVGILILVNELTT